MLFLHTTLSAVPYMVPHLQYTWTHTGHLDSLLQLGLHTLCQFHSIQYCQFLLSPEEGEDDGSASGLKSGGVKGVHHKYNPCRDG